MAYPPPPARAGLPAPPDWGIMLREIGMDSGDFYRQIIGAVTRGSGETSVAWDDFDFAANSDYDPAQHQTVPELIQHGMFPLDAIVWVCGQNRPPGLDIATRPQEDNIHIATNEVYQGFFAWYFSLYTQGRAVGQGNPNFLTAVLNLGAHWSDLINALTSADIAKFPNGWIKYVQMDTLQEKSRNRLALGAAGHRYVSSLKFIRPEDFLPDTDDGQAFIAAIRRWTQDRVWWDLHPITKSGNIITVTGSINKLLEDCLATCVRQERLATLSQSRILHHVPNVVPTHSNWVNFDAQLLPLLNEPIFP